MMNVMNGLLERLPRTMGRQQNKEGQDVLLESKMEELPLRRRGLGFSRIIVIVDRTDPVNKT